PTAKNGGELGWLARGDLAANLDQAAFALPAGGVSDPVTTPQGLRILHVEEKTPAKVVPFEQVQAELTARVQSKKAQGQYDSYVAKLRQTALIQVTAREVPLQVSAPQGPALGTAPPGSPGG